MNHELWRQTACGMLVVFLLQGCIHTPQNYKPYVGVNPANEQFERGRPFAPLDWFGDLLSKIYQLAFWTRRYGNHRISVETEQEVERFLKYHGILDVKVRINQWAPHKEIMRLLKNKQIAWPYKIIFFPSTLIVSIIGRPFSGFLVSDYYDPGSNTINLFSDHPAIALHEAGHAYDFDKAEYRGTYGLIRILPGINLIQEKVATDEALVYLEEKKRYEDLLEAYKVLYPAYSTYAISYLSSSPIALVGALTVGHILGRSHSRRKEQSLIAKGEMPREQFVSQPAATGLNAAPSSASSAGEPSEEQSVHPAVKQSGDYYAPRIAAKTGDKTAAAT